MQHFSPATPRPPPIHVPSSLNPNAKRRPALQTTSFPSHPSSSLGTTTPYSSDSDFTLETTLHHLTDFLTQSLPSLGYTSEQISILRECIAIHLTPKLAPSWDVNNPSSGCGIRSLIALPGKFPTPLVNASRDAGVDVVKWAKGMSVSGEWELWVDPGSICFRDGGWAWVDEGFESRGFKQTLHTIWQTPIPPQTPLGLTSNYPASSPFNSHSDHHPTVPASAPSAPIGSRSHINNPRLFPNAVPIRAPAVFRIPPPPLPSASPGGISAFEGFSLGNGSTPNGSGSASGGPRKFALTAFRSDGGLIEDDGWGEIGQKLGERGTKLMEAAMGEGRGLRRVEGGAGLMMGGSSGGGFGGGGGGGVGFGGGSLLPAVDITAVGFGREAGKRLSIGSTGARSDESRDRSVSGGSSTGKVSLGGGHRRNDSLSNGGEEYYSSEAGENSTDGEGNSTRSRSQSQQQQQDRQNTRDEDGMVFLDMGLMAAIEGSDEEDEEMERAREIPLPATPVPGQDASDRHQRDRSTSGGRGQFSQGDYVPGTPISNYAPGQQNRESPNTPQGAFISVSVPETPASETSEATTIKANNTSSNQPLRPSGIPDNSLPRNRSHLPGSTPSVQPYDGGNVGVLGGGVKLGGQAFNKSIPALALAVPIIGGGNGTSAAAALSATTEKSRSRSGESADLGRGGSSGHHTSLGPSIMPPPQIASLTGVNIAVPPSTATVSSTATKSSNPPPPPSGPSNLVHHPNLPPRARAIVPVVPTSTTLTTNEGKPVATLQQNKPKRRGRPTARSMAHAQNAPPVAGGPAANTAATTAEKPKKGAGVGLVKGVSTGMITPPIIPGGAVPPQMGGSALTGPGAIPAPGPGVQPRWNVGGGGAVLTGVNGIHQHQIHPSHHHFNNIQLQHQLQQNQHPHQHHRHVLGTGISGQPGSGMVLANMNHVQYQQQQQQHFLGHPQGTIYLGPPLSHPHREGSASTGMTFVPGSGPSTKASPIATPTSTSAQSPGSPPGAFSTATTNSTTPIVLAGSKSSNGSMGAVPTAHGLPRGWKFAAGGGKSGSLPPAFVPGAGKSTTANASGD